MKNLGFLFLSDTSAGQELPGALQALPKFADDSGATA